MSPFSFANLSPSSCETWRLQCQDSLLPVVEVALVTNKHDGHLGVSILADLFQPARQVVESVAPRDVIHEKSAGSASVVGPRDGLEGLLSGLGVNECWLTVSQI